MRKTHMDTAGASLMVGFSLLLGLNQALVKLVNAGFAPVFQSGLRSVCAFLPVLLYAVARRGRLTVSDGTAVPGVICGLLFSAEFCLLFLALDYTTVSRVSLFFYTMPFWVALGAHVLVPGERLTPPRVAGLVLAIAGVATALVGEGPDAGATSWIGDALSLVAALFWAAIALVTRCTRLSRSTPEMILLYQLAVSAVVLIGISPLFGELVRTVTPTIIAIFAFQVVMVVSIGFVVWFWVLSVYPVTSMASFGLLAPLFGVFFGWLIFGDRLPGSFVLALALTGAGLLLVNRPAAKSAPPASQVT